MFLLGNIFRCSGGFFCEQYLFYSCRDTAVRKQIWLQVRFSYNNRANAFSSIVLSAAVSCWWKETCFKALLSWHWLQSQILDLGRSHLIKAKLGINILIVWFLLSNKISFFDIRKYGRRVQEKKWWNTDWDMSDVQTHRSAPLCQLHHPWPYTSS